MEPENRKFLYILVITGSLLGFISSLPQTWTSPVVPILEGNSTDNPLDRPITVSESSWMVSLISLGAAIGPLLTAFTTKLTGLKYTLIGLGVAFTVSFLMLAFIDNLTVYFIARVLAGFGVGSVYSVMPPYLADASPDDIRGTSSAVFNIFVMTGLWIPYCVGPYIPIIGLNLLSAAISFSFVIAFFFMPESPVYLITKKKESEAKTILQKLRGRKNVDKEFELMMETEKQNLGGKISDIFTIKSNFKGLIMSSSLVALQQLSGINIVLYNSQTIFDATGSSIPSDISSIIMGGVQVLASCVCPFFIDTRGRKILLLISAIGMLISEAPLGVYFYLSENGYNVDDIYWMPILCLMLYVITFNIGFGPIVWTVTSEVFPPNMMSIGSALTACVCWTTSYFLTQFSTDLTTSVGNAGLFWMFSAFNVVAIVFVAFYLPETKGKSTMDIQKMLR